MKKCLVILTVVLAFTMLMTSFVHAYDYDLNFEDFDEEGSLSDDTDWFVKFGKNTSYATVKEDDNGNKYLEMCGFGYAYYNEEITDPYTFSFDICGGTKKSLWLGSYIRGSIESATASINIGNGETKKMPWFESDGAGKDKEGNGSGTAGFTGTTGIGLRHVSLDGTNTIELVVKTWDTTRQRNIGFIKYDIPMTKDLSTEYVSIMWRDDNAGLVELFVDEVLVATVNYSNLGSYEDDEVGLEGNYYKTASIKDANGNVIADTETALIYEDSLAIFYTRGDQAVLKIDNLSIKVEQPATPVPTEAPATEAPTEAPATDAPTAAPATDAPATKAPTTSEEKGGCGSSSAIAQVMLIIGAALVLKRKK